ncbi:hypothetical protein [Gloeothece verrucosa]|nr:hypothetical protein [Gloeothece verrucosa]
MPTEANAKIDGYTSENNYDVAMAISAWGKAMKIGVMHSPLS